MKKIGTYDQERPGCDINVYELGDDGVRKKFLIEIEDYVNRYANIRLTYNDITKKGYLHSFNNLTQCPLSTTMDYIEHLKNVAEKHFKNIEID
mgnify:CR=1 FL=1